MAQAFFDDNQVSIFKTYRITDEQINALRACIEGQQAVDNIVNTLTQYPSNAQSSVELQQRLCGLWTLLNDRAVGIPTAQPTIISILQTIQTLPWAEIPEDEDRDDFDFDDGYYWRELSWWPSDWADKQNCKDDPRYHPTLKLANIEFTDYFSNYTLEKYSPNEYSKRRASCISANMYTARLAATGDETLAMQGAALDRAGSIAMNDFLKKEEERIDSGCVEAAAQLFIYAAREMFCLIRGDPDAEDVHSQRTQSGQSLMKRKDKPIDGDQWRLFRKRWEEFAEMESLPTETRVAAQKALEAMHQVHV
ncbi:hypothetical protein FSARC_1763 [Fusarium sarcochroum]|uniref:Uncharacterized protein n=1 Tax=Fusarium sarcochroum TaxID=1208366 RepID=A0A8H4U7J7_9HYPO|nr:hypothetical protein FSARC_1763 [Fusarium sarcochroum]